MPTEHYTLQTQAGPIELGEPRIMGILNVTPDSFSDGGRYYDPNRAAEHALEMVEAGADIIDIGGESTRPGSQSVAPSEQIRRVVGPIRAIRKHSPVPISIDTTHSEVARAALEAGASIINDISGLTADPALATLAAQWHAPVVLMHMQGTPRTMQTAPHYDDVVEEILAWLAGRIEAAVGAGIEREQIVIDPGIGFGKTVEHNLTLMRHLEAFHRLRCPVLVGASRKSFIGKVLGIESPSERIWGTAATVSRCVAAGVQIIRVHDVKEMKQVAQMTAAMLRPDATGTG